MRRVYIAAPLASAKRAAQLARTIREMGHKVVSTWHDQLEAVEAPKDPPRDRMRTRIRIFSQNRVELTEADRLLVLVDDGTPRATYCEAGYFLALGHGTVTWRVGPNDEGLCLWSVYDHVATNDEEAVSFALR